MSNADLPGKPAEVSISSSGDIPVALRETPRVESRPRFKWDRLLWGLLGLAIALVFRFFTNGQSLLPHAAPTTVSPIFAPVVQTMQETFVRIGVGIPDTLLGHLPYEETPEDTLVPIVSDGSVLLREAAAEQFLMMTEAATADGITLVPISGFRSIADQEYLFFRLKAQNGEQVTERAEVSAPPGYSEHHTGYAIDIGDASQADTNLEISFETTPAFHWLQDHAAYYSFELSFSRDNPRSISYEPWHWRCVGDRHSLETFYKARTLDGLEGA